MTTTERAPVGRDQSSSDAIAAFVFELGVLKRLPRTGWCQAGVPMPESVADHSCRVGQIAGILAVMEGADMARASLLGLWHDVPEIRTGDLPHSARPYLPHADAVTIAMDQTAGIDGRPSQVICGAIAEFETGDTLEARCARDADKLDCLVQALEYQHAGHKGLNQWVTTSFDALQLPSARVLAHAALNVDPMQWRAGS